MNPVAKKILDYLAANPGSTMTEISRAVDRHRNTVQEIVNNLLAGGRVMRDSPGGLASVYFIREPSPADARFNKARNAAIALEERKLWNRAARQWLVAFDITRNSQHRDDIAKRREHCIAMGKSAVPEGYFS